MQVRRLTGTKKPPPVYNTKPDKIRLISSAVCWVCLVVLCGEVALVTDNKIRCR